MGDDYAECPVCQCRLSTSLLERHVNLHLDEDDFDRDQAVARQVASTPEPILQLRAMEKPEYCGRNGKECESGSYTNCFTRNSTLGRCRNASVEAKIQVLLATQKKGFFDPVDEGLMNLLKMGLESEQQVLSCATISGHVDHFQTFASEDVGWGCGWRNIQMLSSHLLTKNWGVRDVLFGGAGFVPDIPSLQQWLEVAWAQGFDAAGADWYHWKIHGSKKWIGATECAALLRSFGLHAQIVDFSNASHLAGMLVNDSIHHNVQCDLCGVYPIRGTRFRSTEMNDFDVCSVCIASIGQSYGHFERIETSNTNTQIKGKGIVKDGLSSHQSLVDWVWGYFTNNSKDISSRVRIEHLHGCIFTSERTPLYFQHQGHSRTIVGMQRCRKPTSSQEELFLLVLDPAICTGLLAKSLRAKVGWQKFIKRGLLC
eukprot:c24505_g1_i2 orf=233-1513(+)